MTDEMISPQYDIQQLVDLTGIPRRTVHFYTQQGIIPPPNGAGLASRYDDRHLLRLQALRILREQGLRLDEIRQQFSSITVDDLRLLVQNAPTLEAQPRLSKAAFVAEPQPMFALQPLPTTPQLIERFSLSDGIEISAPADLPPVVRKKLMELVIYAKQLLLN